MMAAENYSGEADSYIGYFWDLFAPFLTLLVAIGGGIAFLYFYRSCKIVIHWARTNGFKIVSIKIPLNPGPLWGDMLWPECQIVYYATILTPHNQMKSAWVLCGNNWLSLFSNHVVVEWDEKPDQRIGIKMPFVSWLSH